MENIITLVGSLYIIPCTSPLRSIIYPTAKS